MSRNMDFMTRIFLLPMDTLSAIIIFFLNVTLSVPDRTMHARVLSFNYLQLQVSITESVDST